MRRFASAVRVARGSTESRRTGSGSAGYQDILESHRRLVVEIFLDNAPAIWHNRPLTILRAGRDALAPGSALTLIEAAFNKCEFYAPRK